MLDIYREQQFKRKTPAIEYPEGAGGREVCTDSAAGRREYKNRTDEMCRRQGWLCGICREPMRPEEATFEHADGRGHGGGHRDDRITINGKRHNSAAHGLCNVKKGSKRA